MADAFAGGTAAGAGSTSSSTTATPNWYQDAVYGHIQNVNNIASQPYQDYQLPTTAGLSNEQQAAVALTNQSVGQYQGKIDSALQSLQGVAGGGGGGGMNMAGVGASGSGALTQVQPYMDKQTNMLETVGSLTGAPSQTMKDYVDYGLQSNGLNAAAPYLQKQAEQLGNINYGGGAQTFENFLTNAGQYDPLKAASAGMNEGTDMARAAGTATTAGGLQQAQQAALAQSGLSAAQPDFDAARSGMTAAGAVNTADRLRADQAAYLNPDAQRKMMEAGQQYYGQAGQLNGAAAAQPYLQQAAGMSGSVDAKPYLQQAVNTTQQSLGERATAAADPYANAAAQSSAAGVQQYMNPYNAAVTDRLAELGGRNLSEQLLPNVSDAFIRAGSFGGSRMGEFGSRAVRDTQEAVLAQQAQALQQGYGQALGASQADLARQAQLAGTVGGLAGTDLSRIMQGGAQYGNLAQTAGNLTAQEQAALTNIGQTTGNLTSQQMQNLTSLGNAQTSAGQAQQQFGLTAAQQAQQAATSDANRQLQAAQAQASLGASAGQLQGQQQTNMLTAAGQTQAAQAQDYQRQLAAAQQLSDNGRNMGALTQAQQQLLLSAGNQAANIQQNQTGHELAGASHAGQFAMNVGALTQAQQQAIMSGGKSISDAQQAALGTGINIANQYGNQASTAGNIIGNANQTSASLATGMASANASLTNAQVNAATGMGTLAQAGQNMTLKDINALGSAGALTQGATQAQLDAAKAQFDAQQNYAKNMATWQGGQLGAGSVPTTTTGSTQTVVPTASPLSQLASGAALLAQ